MSTLKTGIEIFDYEVYVLAATLAADEQLADGSIDQAEYDRLHRFAVEVLGQDVMDGATQFYTNVKASSEDLAREAANLHSVKTTLDFLRA